MSFGGNTIIERSLLEQLADERLGDFDTLVAGGRYAAAIYPGVYAVECLLEAHICKSLDLQALPETYEKHHLLVLLLHSGLNRRIQEAEVVYDNLRKLDGIWNPADRARNIRYIDPSQYVRELAELVRGWLVDPQCGVVTWLRSQL